MFALLSLFLHERNSSLVSTNWSNVNIQKKGYRFHEMVTQYSSFKIPKYPKSISRDSSQNILAKKEKPYCITVLNWFSSVDSCSNKEKSRKIFVSSEFWLLLLKLVTLLYCPSKDTLERLSRIIFEELNKCSYCIYFAFIYSPYYVYYVC